MTQIHEPVTVPSVNVEQRPVGSPAPRAMSAAKMRSSQRAVMRRYRHEPQAAWTSDGASTGVNGPVASDPVYTLVKVSREHDVFLPVSVHEKIGGPQDLPVPGDILSAALAACLDQAIRLIATQLNVRLERLAVHVLAELDVRGTLLVDADTPVGFQSIRVDVDVAAAEGTDPDMVQRVLMAAEYCCVTLQTLRNGVDVQVHTNRTSGEA